jgi:serine phosphatase RsbU (regulator of sigma subunit)
MLRRANGALEEPSTEEAGLPLGIVEDFDYVAATVTLNFSDSLTMYTDGIDEAMDRDGKQYTIDRMRDMVKASDGIPENIGKSLLADVRKHLNGKPQDDDMCLVSLRRQTDIRETAPLRK